MTEKQKMQAKVKKDMRTLGTYRKEYDRMIEIYVDLNMQYDQASAEFLRTGCEYETETGAGGTKKSGIVSALESLRKDIITYSDRLCLNPKTIDNIKTAQTKPTSKLADALNAYAKKS